MRHLLHMPQMHTLLNSCTLFTREWQVHEYRASHSGSKEFRGSRYRSSFPVTGDKGQIMLVQTKLYEFGTVLLAVGLGPSLQQNSPCQKIKKQ